MMRTISGTLFFALVALQSPALAKPTVVKPATPDCGLALHEAFVCKDHSESGGGRSLEVMEFRKGCQVYWGEQYPPGPGVAKLLSVTRRTDGVRGKRMDIGYRREVYGDTVHYLDLLMLNFDNLSRSQLVQWTRRDRSPSNCYQSGLPCAGAWEYAGTIPLDCSFLPPLSQSGAN